MLNVNGRDGHTEPTQNDPGSQVGLRTYSYYLKNILRIIKHLLKGKSHPNEPELMKKKEKKSLFGATNKNASISKKEREEIDRERRESERSQEANTQTNPRPNRS
jgi:hypothetical protein